MSMIVVVTRDLMVSSQISGAARGAACEMQVAGDSEAAAALSRVSGCCGVLLDLTMPGVDLQQLLAGLSEARPPVIAFGPHVHTTTLEAARAAGCDRVLSRGEFVSRLHEIVSALTGPEGSG